jgi:uncharacterized membrane protein YgdD (TMEM256/DUF423 family)
MTSRFPLLAAGLLGLTGVALGAFGAHALRETLMAQGTRGSWDTAVHYHLFHTAAVFGAAIWSSQGVARKAARQILSATYCWTAGVILFSGSLYGLALQGPRWLGPITPIGGLAFLAGWACVAAAGLAKHEA